MSYIILGTGDIGPVIGWQGNDLEEAKKELHKMSVSHFTRSYEWKLYSLAEVKDVELVGYGHRA